VRDGGIIEEFPVAERRSVSPIDGRLIDGGRFDSRTLAGKVVVYNIWGSWCVPCRKEAPDLKRLADGTRDEGVRFVGVDVKDNDASAVAFQREFSIRYPSIGTADSGAALLALGNAVPLGAVPTTVVVDPRAAWRPGSWGSPATTR
jgi:thiol-disulfide isomerase/thioredoxin